MRGTATPARQALEAWMRGPRTGGLDPLLPGVRETLPAGIGDRRELDRVRQLGQVRHVVAHAQRHLL